MKLQKIDCPNCGGNIKINVQNRTYVFCPYCGQRFYLDDETKTTINKIVNYTKRVVNESQIIKEKAEARKNMFILIFVVGLTILYFVVTGIGTLSDEIKEKKAIQEGKIS